MWHDLLTLFMWHDLLRLSMWHDLWTDKELQEIALHALVVLMSMWSFSAAFLSALLCMQVGLCVVSAHET